MYWRTVALALAVSLGLAAEASAAQFDTTLISRATGATGANSGGEARESAISADGRFVTFRSAATNLSPDDNDVTADVYVRDRQTSTTTLVSRASGASGAKSNGPSSRPMVSGDGRFVVFESSASNLDPADTDAQSDVYVRDLMLNTTVLVSRVDGVGGARGNFQSLDPSISDDGDRVVFETSANNLTPDDVDSNQDIVMRDVSASTTTLISRATGGANGNLEASNPSIAGDGGSVAFDSTATNLDAADADGNPDVFVRDVGAGTTTLASRATGATGANSNQRADDASISDDGARVAFHSWADNLSPDDTDTNSDVFVRDLAAATTGRAARRATASSRRSPATGTSSRGPRSSRTSIPTTPTRTSTSSCAISPRARRRS